MALKDWKKIRKSKVIKEATKMKVMSKKLSKLLGTGNYMVTTLEEYSKTLKDEWSRF